MLILGFRYIAGIDLGGADAACLERDIGEIGKGVGRFPVGRDHGGYRAIDCGEMSLVRATDEQLVASRVGRLRLRVGLALAAVRSQAAGQRRRERRHGKDPDAASAMTRIRNAPHERPLANWSPVMIALAKRSSRAHDGRPIAVRRSSSIATMICSHVSAPSVSPLARISAAMIRASAIAFS